ncbi:TetR/AcrR family transcriptional regulator [[Mycobacterium] burgundiense]|uniref:TetR/AcrR family transcriptional regulator n=1 Tax=[Mycobacterium] burgundiense TaxID=3064286 RepID=A0ABM9LGX8_9MYCO|nr:TetR/AcrR family transcriptional regulator [Mycolicibacterium sp. MU0053]CAJ1498774.1 TetR/AcrR family transcriptional regulator [Mycolicibacterium sp. MU0053]
MPRSTQPARDRLLRAADELFYAHGIAGTGVDAVIEKAGVATGSLYKNFGGKAALVAAYLADRDRRFRELWETHIESAGDARARLLALFAAHADWAQQTGGRRGCAHVAAATQLPADHVGVAAAVEHKRRLVARLIELAESAGASEPRELAHELALIYDGMLSAQAIGIDPDPLARARRLAARVVEAGLGTR